MVSGGDFSQKAVDRLGAPQADNFPMFASFMPPPPLPQKPKSLKCYLLKNRFSTHNHLSAGNIHQVLHKIHPGADVEAMLQSTKQISTLLLLLPFQALPATIRRIKIVHQGGCSKDVMLLLPPRVQTALCPSCLLSAVSKSPWGTMTFLSVLQPTLG